MQSIFLKIEIRKLNDDCLSVALVLGVFLYSMVFGPYYTGGDQVHYRNVYDGLSGLSLTEGLFYYRLNLDSREVMHFLLSWAASNLGLDKDFFVAISNSFLACFVVALLRKLNVSIFIIALLLLTNFYFNVLYFSAERLKFGFIFLILSILYARAFYVFSLLSIISHVQILIIYVSILLDVLVHHLVRFFSVGKIKASLMIVLALFPLVLMFLGEHILLKLQRYYSAGGFLGMWKIIIFLVLSLWYSKNKIQVICVFTPMLVVVFLIGGDRVNMMGYFVFLYYALQVRNGFNLGVLVTSAYFLYASVGFIGSVITHGDAFYAE